MLRWVISLLVLANVVFYAWTQGHLTSLGFAPSVQTEPERLHAQIQPEVMRLMNPPQPRVEMAPPLKPAAAAEAAAASQQPDPASPGAQTAATAVAAVTPNAAPTAAPTPPTLPPTSCWVAGGFTTPQIRALEKRMLNLALPKGSWRTEDARSGGRWVVYMGRYNEELLARKKEELRELKVEFRTLSEAPLAMGLALGTYSSEAAAEQGLKDVAKKGVRSARVAQERDESVSHTLRLAEVTPEERSAVEALGETLLAGKRFRSCD